MKCVQFESTGEPSRVLTCVECDRPSPKHGEVLVRMLASPVNPSDLMFVRGVYGVEPQLPQSPGFEGVGIVEASGGGLRGKLFHRKRVAVLNRAGGNWSEYAVVPAAQVIPVSNQLSVEQAATFFVNPATAWIMIQEVLKVRSGEWLLQTAAGSSLGMMVARLGHSLGFRTLNVVRNEEAVADLKAAGATEVVVFDPAKDSVDELLSSIRGIVGERKVRYAIDPVGGATGSAVVKELGHQGRMLVFGTLSEQPLQLNPRTLMTQQTSVEGFWLGNFMNDRNLLFKLKLVKRITRLILDGVLSTSIGETFSLDQISQAVTAAEEKARSGKVLLQIGN
ncbi:MAG: zinc-dependent alcohol dehydrogenase family protein [Fuerstiella sp.]|nr:zinc-dependent alcohol dehydrogenase family protein [Fuerstiella sp.]MCP4512697.1 zinc-dependent alcohol dehydrogenase family protein [Fuerstiella sp.]